MNSRNKRWCALGVGVVVLFCGWSALAARPEQVDTTYATQRVARDDVQASQPSSKKQSKESVDAAFAADRSLPSKRPDSTADKTDAPDDAPMSVTHHLIEVMGKTIDYTATAGLMPIAGDDGKTQAEIFFVAYTRNGTKAASRPIMFAFNGGPGAATIWLHMAAMGPKRAVLAAGGRELPREFRLIDNEHTWLDFTDLVFIDPVGTGFSRAAPGADAKRYYAMDADVEVIGSFVRQYTTRYGRWLSPKYLAGESYGTTRAVALAGYLQNDVGMLLKGLVLISSALDFQTIVFDRGNDLPNILFFPTYTATAWYHGLLSAELQNESLEKVLLRSLRWANVEYRLALSMGSSLGALQCDEIIRQYALYSGLSESFIRTNNLRISNMQFIHEILKEKGLVAGLLDGRVTGLAAGREGFVTDPSLFVTLGPLVATLYHYVREDLGYKTGRQYEFLNADVSRQWNWGSAVQGYPSVVPTLQQVMSANTHLRVHMACGYYDLDTSYMSQRYTADHAMLDKSIADHLELSYYPAGHQLYTFLPALESLTKRIRAFVQAGE